MVVIVVGVVVIVVGVVVIVVVVIVFVFVSELHFMNPYSLALPSFPPTACTTSLASSSSTTSDAVRSSLGRLSTNASLVRDRVLNMEPARQQVFLRVLQNLEKALTVDNGDEEQ